MKKPTVKLILDIVMSIIWISLMVYSQNIALLHETAGLFVLMLFILHKALNFKWIKNTTSKLFTRDISAQTRFKYILDAVLLICMTFAGLSGVMISDFIFNIEVGDRAFWMSVHDTFCWACTIIMSVHIGLHWKMITAQFKKMLKIKRVGGFANVLAKAIAVMILIFGVKASFANNVYTKLTSIIDYSFPQENNESFAPTSTVMNENKTEATVSAAEESQQTSMSVEEYLGNLHCTGCSKHCSLLSPRCSTGRSQATSATAEYEANIAAAAAEQESAKQQTSSNTTTDNANSDNTQSYIEFSDDNDDSVKKMFSDIIPIMGMYIAGTYYVLKYTKK